jgi:hypothetical protein
MKKMNLTDVSHLIASKLSLPEVAELSGWDIKSIQTVYRTGLWKDEIECEDNLEEELTSDLEFDTEDIYTDGWENFSLEREEGDPEELDFNDY